MWQYSGYNGIFFLNPANGPNPAQKNYWYYTGNFDNVASSLYNKRQNATLISRFYPPSAPDIACVPSQWAYSNLATTRWPSGDNVDNTISSYNYLTGGC
jgi:hypothetical protein